MKLSVVIVNYKTADLLVNCLEKLVSCPHEDAVQIIVVDNASNDGSGELIGNRFPEVIFIRNSRNIGFARAVNRGTARADGDIILLLNPDTVPDEGALSALMQFYREYPGAGIAGGNIINSDGTFQRQCMRNIPRPLPSLFRLLHLHRLFPHASLANAYEMSSKPGDSITEVEAVSGAMLAVPRKIWDEVGGMDETFFLFGEDLDLCYRVLKAGYKNYFVPTARVMHILGASRRKRPIRTLWHTHHAMHHFYRKHYASRRNFLLNLCIMTAIWTRWAVMTTVTAIRNGVTVNRSDK